MQHKIKHFGCLLILMGVVCIAVIASAQNSAQIPTPPQAKAVALVGGTVHTLSGPAIENATILFDNGKIVAIGSNVTVPADAVSQSIAGKHVYPSIIEMVSNLGLIEVDAVNASADYAELGDINPNVRAEVAINPDSELLPVARANGIGMAVSLPRSGLISGKGALIQLDGWTWEDMALKAPVCMVLNWPRMTNFNSPWVRVSPEQQKRRREEQLKALSGAFEQARAYQKAKEAAGESGVPFHAVDARWEAMMPVLKGELPLWVNASEIKQILAAVDWATRENVKIVLNGAADAYMVTDLLKSKNIPVIVGGVLNLPSRRDEGFDSPFALPLKLYEAGVKFAIAGGGSWDVRNLPYHAAKAASYGLPVEEAIKSITLYPAQILGIDDRIGTLEAGKDASLIVTDGNPLELTTHVEKLYLQGRDIDLNNKHKALYKKYRQKYIQRGHVAPTDSE